jgi:hypothetical protein
MSSKLDFTMTLAIRAVCLIFVLALAAPASAIEKDIQPKKQCQATTPEELEKWQTDCRTLLFDMLKLSDLAKKREESVNAIPFNVKTLSKTSLPGYTREEIEFDSTPTRRIKAILTTPENTTGHVPAVICIHGHGGDRNIVYAEKSLYRAFAKELASHGYVTISTDVGQHEVYEAGRELMGERLWDVLRCADYVSTLEHVDKDRMGCGGLSLGGEMAMWLGAMDPRIKVTISSGYLSTVKNMQNGHCMCWDFPGFTENFDFCDIYSMIAPRRLLCQIGAKESAPGGFPASVAHEAMAKIQRAYAIGNNGHHAQLDVHPFGHVFITADGCHFFDEALKSEITSATGGGGG